ncbi:NERD domain-containing protein [Bacillus sp. 17RED48]|uniref:nuclease-related domain-containing protein n=1 Tax=Bacillus sp. 17RED48 TaxID=2778093 RepID=UPI001C9A9BFE|nr:nuclease-related domain-containing protein [Bacillus sp. 17RED48]MBY7114895.1 NERD domain-containing protein [Bacillus sp. 17RED48]MCU4863613.1 NERD domain-containing protein [Bacillus cereus]MCU4948810.1 NERD domain-containing protein [Bacillus cereus]
MVYIICIVFILISGSMAYFFYKKTNALHTEKQVMLQEHQKEKNDIEHDLKQENQNLEVAYKNILIQEKEKYETEVAEIQESINELNNYIEDIQKYSRNSGEIITHQILSELKRTWVSNGALSETDMYIIPNVFIPFTYNGKVRTRQIDHLILLPVGIYVVETKYWRGKIIHGLTKKRAKDFSFLLDMIPNSKKDAQTLVFIPSQSTDETGKLVNTIQVRSYGEPTDQASKTAVTLNEYLNTHLSWKVPYITPVVYFGYPNQGNNGLIELANENKVNRFNTADKLKNFFRQELVKSPKLNAVQLQEIRSIVEQVNYLESASHAEKLISKQQTNG